MRRRLVALGLAGAIVAGGACVADVRLPWMVLVADGREYDGLLVSYCWTTLAAGVCADGALREPPVHTVPAAGPVAVQARTASGLKELSVRVGDDWRSGELAPIDLAKADALRLGPGVHYIALSARWPRGDGLFLFGLRVEPRP